MPDGNGNVPSCYSTVHMFGVRANTELRCEPNLEDFGDPYVAEFRELFEAHRATLSPSFPTGPPGRSTLPGDYALRQPLLRRLEYGFHKYHSEGTAADAGPYPPAPAPVTSVFDVSLGGAMTDPIGTYGPDYLESGTHQWLVTGDRASRRADHRNPLVTIDLDGSVVDNTRLFIKDTVDGSEDCVHYDGRHPTERTSDRDDLLALRPRLGCSCSGLQQASDGSHDRSHRNFS